MDAFDKYVSSFDLNNRLVKLKYNHSIRVMNLNELLAKELNFSKDDVAVAKLIGQLHDIGRFKQVTDFNNLNDCNMDHADYGAYLLFDEELIKLFSSNKNIYNLIEFCVKNHNKYSLGQTNDESFLKQLKLIKDSDKIDIFNIWANLDEIEFKDDGNISLEVKNEFYNNTMIHNYNKKTNADRLIGTLSYIFEMYYDKSYEYILEKHLIDNLYNRVSDKEKYYDYFKYSKDYVLKRSKGE